MEKMGWEEGKDLGAKEDGNREHIKIKCFTLKSVTFSDVR
jgi:hypothetical protein